MWNFNFGKKPEIDPKDPDKEWHLIEHVVADAFSEQKKARRWGVLFKILTFAYLFGLLVMFYAGPKATGFTSPSKPHIAVVKVHGVISHEDKANAGSIGTGLRRAFENEAAKAVVLAINSPGGSPVQSGYIYDEIVRLKLLHPEKKVYAVIADIGASGAYYIAAAADEIYADKASLVGSIGVTASGFGFVNVIDKLGIERRHFTAGEHKSFLDPFSPLKEDEKQFWQAVLDNTHQQFIDAVRDGRGDRLQMTAEITSGLIWNGEQAKALGLIDGLGGVRHVAREVVGHEDLKDYTPKESPFKAMLEQLGVSVGKGIGQTLQAQLETPKMY